jgi:formylglycine-generating enzyme
VRTAYAAVIALACARHAEPFGTVIIELDTDLPVPRLASRARIDIHREDGTWIASRDVSLRSRDEFPATFSVFSSDTARVVVVRVRLSPEAAVVDYRGERRLIADGVDITPLREPDPGLAIDRLVRVAIEHGVERRTSIFLGGECAGVVADLDAHQSCTSEPRTGTFGDTTAAVVPRPGEVAIAGKAFILGSRDIVNEILLGGVFVSSAPPRLVVVSPFVIDRTEVTVGRYRAAVARGFAKGRPTDPVINPVPIPIASEGRFNDRFCTLTVEGDTSRDAMPLNCMSFGLARAFCQFEGGDLPTEAEWELAAAASNRPTKTTFPWGDYKASCAAAVFGRMDLSSAEHGLCSNGGAAPIGPAPVNTGSEDVTPDGVHDLAGNVAEWTLDVYGPYDGPCWAKLPQRDPVCLSDDRRAFQTVRGGSFAGPHNTLVATVRKAFDPDLPYPGFGFRCVRHGVR